MKKTNKLSNDEYEALSLDYLKLRTSTNEARTLKTQ